MSGWAHLAVVRVMKRLTNAFRYESKNCRVHEWVRELYGNKRETHFSIDGSKQIITCSDSI